MDVVREYYEVDSMACRILIRHGEDVARKAVACARNVPHLQPDLDFIREAAMLHDIAIFLAGAPKLGCFGRFSYLCHGYLGREILERLSLPNHALVCERHVGCGMSASEIRERKLSLPQRDMIPMSIEEELVCYADKFFFKKSPAATEEKSMEEIISALSLLGQDKVDIFRTWALKFGP